jgi:hypothetical protein
MEEEDKVRDGSKTWKSAKRTERLLLLNVFEVLRYFIELLCLQVPRSYYCPSNFSFSYQSLRFRRSKSFLFPETRRIMKGQKFLTPSLGWLLFCNICMRPPHADFDACTNTIPKAIFAVTICILSGCRTKSQGNYSLINYDRQTLGIVFGENCGNTSAVLLPDTYKLGLSGRLFTSLTSLIY